jgi:hypothetical protein
MRTVRGQPDRGLQSVDRRQPMRACLDQDAHQRAVSAVSRWSRWSAPLLGWPCPVWATAHLWQAFRCQCGLDCDRLRRRRGLLGFWGGASRPSRVSHPPSSRPTRAWSRGRARRPRSHLGSGWSCRPGGRGGQPLRPPAGRRGQDRRLSVVEQASIAAYRKDRRPGGRPVMSGVGLLPPGWLLPVEVARRLSVSASARPLAHQELRASSPAAGREPSCC